MRRDSLAFRLVIGAALWSALMLAAGGLALSLTFREAAHRSFDLRLQAMLDSLIATTDHETDSGIERRRPLTDTRFELVYSGWYWQIDGAKGPPALMRSRSLFDLALTLPEGLAAEAAGGPAFARIPGPQGQDLRLAVRRVEYGDGSTFFFLVAGDRAEVVSEISGFNRTVSMALGVLMFGLLAGLVLQVHFGLRPLDRVARGIARIRSGETGKLEGPLPAEIEPLADELNRLIDAQRAMVERAHNQASNLAHGLKTPLAVLLNEAASEDTQLGETVRRQSRLMKDQMDHHLARARSAASAAAYGQRTEVRPVLEGLKRTLERIYERDGIEIALDCPAGLAFAGEEQDLQELAGNLMENACKWAISTVSIVAAPAEDGDGRRPYFRIDIADDGPGLSPEDRKAVLARGKRLDEKVPGSGFGLSIVDETAGLYGGSLELAEAEQGGLLARLHLPRGGPRDGMG